MLDSVDLDTSYESVSMCSDSLDRRSSTQTITSLPPRRPGPINNYHLILAQHSKVRLGYTAPIANSPSSKLFTEVTMDTELFYSTHVDCSLLTKCIWFYWFRVIFSCWFKGQVSPVYIHYAFCHSFSKSLLDISLIGKGWEKVCFSTVSYLRTKVLYFYLSIMCSISRCLVVGANMDKWWRCAQASYKTRKRLWSSSWSIVGRFAFLVSGDHPITSPGE